jgi:hypothetical protein
MKFLNTLTAAATIAMSILATPAFATEEFNVEGYWVVLAAVQADAPNRDALEEVERQRLKPCGYEAFNDLSMKWDGFVGENSTIIVVWSAFPTKQKANEVLKKVKPCFADAYVKKARYLGE